MAGIVIVGAGLAALRGAETLRNLGYDGDLTIVGDERHHPYNRPPLSKQLLAGTQDERACRLDTDRARATWLLGRTATGLHPARRTIELDDATELHYTKLLIATGVRPRLLPDQPRMSNVHVLRTLDDALALRAAALNSHRTVIIGAGFLGCETAATLRTLGTTVSLVDVADHPMPALGPEVGARALAWHAEAGVDLRLSTGVSEILGQDRVTAVRLTDGDVLPTDLIVVAIGAVPNSEWLRASGLTTWHGAVLCDDRCLAVGHDDIAVAGDIAAWPHQNGDIVHVEHWSNAAETAIVAATNLLTPDDPIHHHPVLSFWSDQYDRKLRAVGVLDGADTVEVTEEDRNRLVVEFRRDGALTGAVTVNAQDRYLRHRRALRDAQHSTPAAV